MKREDIEGYYEAYNSGDFETVSNYYTDDVIFEYQGNRYDGKNIVFDWFAELGQAFKEVMLPLNILIEGDKIAVELENRIEAKTDIPDLLGKSIELKTGESGSKPHRLHKM